MAITPRSYGKTCTMSMLNAGVFGSSWKDDTADSIKEGFEESVDFRIVYRNMDYSKQYKTWVYEGNASEKTVGYLHLMSYPYDTVQFNIGDYIQFNYRHENVNPSQYKFWILQSLDTRNLYEVRGRMLPCNQKLKWKDDNGKSYSYPCYFNTEMTKTNILDSNQGFNVESGALIAIVQQNKDTKKIFVNQRFVLNGRTYIVYQFNDNIDQGLIYVYLRITSELPEDDLINEYAYNGFELIADTTLNGDVINVANITSLLQGDDLNINIYNYVLGTKTDDTFSAVVYDVPNTYYTFVADDSGNNYVLHNVKQYRANPLKIEFTNLTTDNVTTIEVWLGGAL